MSKLARAREAAARPVPAAIGAAEAAIRHDLGWIADAADFRVIRFPAYELESAAAEFAADTLTWFIGVGRDIAGGAGPLLPLAELTCRLADGIQDDVIESYDNTWPRCPDHDHHPMWAKVIDNRACWTCSSGSAIVVIGQTVR